MKYKNILQ